MAKDEQKDLIDLPQLGHKKRTTFDAPVKVSTVQEDPILALARDPNVDPDKLQKIIDMYNAQKALAAKQEFDSNFALMQVDFEGIKATRGKQGYNYKYAPIEMLTAAYGPTIAKHGFSFRWGAEKKLEDGGKQSVLIISGWGHREEITFDVPKIEGTKEMNAIQVAGAMSTYGRRYTFLAGFGITVEDEDTDGTFDEGVKYSAFVQLVTDAKDIEELKAQRALAFQQLGDDRRGKEIVAKAARKRAEELQK